MKHPGALGRRLTLILVSTTLALTLLISLGILLGAWNISRSISESHREQLLENHAAEHARLVEETALSLAASLADPVLHADPALVDDLVEMVKNGPLVASASVIAADGTLLHSSGDTLPPIDTVVTELTTRDGITVAPIRLGERTIGTLALAPEPSPGLASGESDALSNPARAQFTVLWILALAALVILTITARQIAVFTGRWLTTPLKQLAEVANDIGRGDYSVRPHINRDDEIGDLSRAIDGMAGNLQSQHDSVQYLAYHDPLTDLYNRLSFQNYIESALSAQSDTKRLLVILINLDDFRVINDLRSQETGDRMLQTVARRVSETVHRLELEPENRDSEIFVARTGGDEFAVLVPNPWRTGLAASMAEQILQSVAEPVPANGDNIRLSASIGVACYPRDDRTPSGLLNCASMALFHSKLQGKNLYTDYAEINHHGGLNATRLKEDFRRAMQVGGDELYLSFQPILNLTTGQLFGAESLMRWNHPTLGAISPDQFIPLIEHSELALDLDLWVVRHACALLAQLRDKRIAGFHLSANISVANLVREHFPEEVAEILHQTDVDPGNLHLEITESYLYQDEERARGNIARLQRLGLQIWLDDFGTGYSSLSHLRNLQVEGIKIDKMFVDSLGEHIPDRAMVSAMIGLSRAFEIAVVAEGIETREQVEILQALGCRYGQGFLFSQALRGQDLLEKMERGANFFRPGN